MLRHGIGRGGTSERGRTNGEGVDAQCTRKAGDMREGGMSGVDERDGIDGVDGMNGRDGLNGMDRKGVDAIGRDHPCARWCRRWEWHR